MKKVIGILTLTIILGTGAVYAASGTTSFDCDITGCTKTGVHYHKNYNPENCTYQYPTNSNANNSNASSTRSANDISNDSSSDTNNDMGNNVDNNANNDTGSDTSNDKKINITEPVNEDFDCGIDGCVKTGVHYHKNYDPENCINPNGPVGDNSGNGTCPYGNGNGNGHGNGNGACPYSNGNGNGYGNGKA